MARSKSVKSLFHLSLIKVCTMIISTSESICKRHGSSISSKFKKQLNIIQRHFLNHIHPHFLDEIVNSLHEYSSFEWFVNDKIKNCVVAVCMHPLMKCFKPRFQLPVNDDLYIGHLKSMTHLRSLNLSMVCSDEILEVVGKSCPLLEFIDITSKVESATNSAIQFNALKLRFFVSDKGLEYLQQCKCLQKVVMNGIIRSNCGGRKISNVGIKNLLLHLNMLKFINYQDMGLVLDEIAYEDRRWGLLINLMHLQDNHVNLQHIDLFSLLCPKLRSLTLCIPQNNASDDLSSQCLERLSTNGMMLSSLDLWFFTFDSYMLNFLQLKGSYLSSLSLKNCKDISTESLLEICKHCPNLKILKINLMSRAEIGSVVPRGFCFRNLEEFHLAGTRWNPNDIFNMCIVKSLGLKVLSLFNKEFNNKLDSEIKYLMLKNPLSELVDLALLEGCKISFPLLKDFLTYCESLSRLTIIDDNTDDFSEQLICFATTNPFDISIDIKIERNR